MTECDLLREMYEQNVALAGQLLDAGEYGLAVEHLKAAAVQVQQISEVGQTQKRELIEV